MAQLRQALLTTVDPLADLHPSTGGHPVTSGGRLNADAALTGIDALVAPNTKFTQKPTGTAGDGQSTFAFQKADTKAPASFECSLDSEPFTDCTSPMTPGPLSDGEHTFSVRAKDQSVNANTDPTPATADWTVDVPVVQPPAAVGQLTIRRSHNGKHAKVSWSAVAGATGYQYRISKPNSQTYGAWSSTDETKARFRDLVKSAVYRVQVVAVNSGEQSPVTTALIPRR